MIQEMTLSLTIQVPLGIIPHGLARYCGLWEQGELLHPSHGTAAVVSSGACIVSDPFVPDTSNIIFVANLKS